MQAAAHTRARRGRGPGTGALAAVVVLLLVAPATAAPHPRNDDRDAAARLTAAGAHGSTRRATLERGEPRSCGARYNRTVWYSWRVRRAGVAVFSLGSAPGALAVYVGPRRRPRACTVEADRDGVTQVVVRVNPGTYAVQVGTRAGERAPRKGFDLEVEFVRDPVSTSAPASDRDGDGTVDAADCAPDDPGIHRGAADVPGDGIDQDCSGADAPIPVLAAQVDVAWARTRSGAGFVRRVEVLRANRGTRIEVRCEGRSCRRQPPIVRRVRRSVNRLTVALGRLADRRLTPGTIVEVRLTRPRTVGLVRTLEFRRRERPVSVLGCLAAGSGRRIRCPRA